jgi:hypothetical protein
MTWHQLVVERPQTSAHECAVHLEPDTQVAVTGGEHAVHQRQRSASKA